MVKELYSQGLVGDTARLQTDQGNNIVQVLLQLTFTEEEYVKFASSVSNGIVGLGIKKPGESQ
jgi:hypothetical protein